MLKLTLRQLFAHKIRFVLTTFAVVLGVAFVVASFVLADSLRSVFDELSGDIAQGTDAQVRGVEQFEGDESSRLPVDESLLDEVRAVDGVALASGDVGASGIGTILDENGERLTDGPAPPQIFNWEGPDETIGQIELLEGEVPDDTGVAVDLGTAEDEGIALGDQIAIRALGPATDLTVQGIVQFGDENSNLAGASLWLVSTSTAQELFGLEGQYLSISVAAEDGVSPEELVENLSAALPDTVEAITGEEVAEEFSQAFSGFIDIFRNALLGFALVALVVSAFLINNTFNIILGQRLRELALLRALGASGRQVIRAVILEALLVGLLASGVGVGAGLLVAMGLQALIESQGGGLPEGALIVTAFTWIVAFVVGVGVTTLAAVASARKASTIPPVAAMRDEGFSFDRGGVTRRFVLGSVVLVLGIVMLAVGLFGDAGSTAGLLTLLGGGALLIFIAVAALSPLVARPVAKTLGWPVAKLFGTAGRLSQENAARSPRRTAATASALMVGLALVAMAATVGESFKQSFLNVIDNSIEADVFVQSSSFAPFSPQFVQDLEALDEIENAMGVRIGDMRVDDTSRTVYSVQADSFQELFDLGIVEGSADGLADDGLLLHQDPAEDLGVSVGDTIEATFLETGTVPLTVVGIYEDASIIENWVIDQSTFEENLSATSQLDFIAAARFVEDADPEQAIGAAKALGDEAYPELTIQDREEFKADQEAQLDQALFTISALLVFAVVIAALGIANTMALSVYERTRELGLLRAVGMSRRQLRRMVRWESVLVAIFGAALGVVLGLLFGFAAVSAMPESFVNTFAVPVPTLVTIVIASGIVGVLAAFFPARRAGKLNVLQAISHE
ncbi:MAG: FtsX-like permease family protein [Actinomycetota bacterium]|nr:FtsX-like permease family protein [Actinomycetota bacterium]